jgi:hypothetical protein
LGFNIDLHVHIHLTKMEQLRESIDKL